MTDPGHIDVIAGLESELPDDRALYLDLRDTELGTELWAWPADDCEWRGVEVLPNVAHRKGWHRSTLTTRFETVGWVGVRDRDDAPEPR